MLDFLKGNSYTMVKMFLDQIAFTVFGTMISIATLANPSLLLASSIFATLFYLFVIYTVGWEVGAKDKIRIDGGRMRPFAQKGALISLFANIPNIILALLMGLGALIDTEWSQSVSIACNAIARLINGMYLGLLKTVEDALTNAGVISGTLAETWWWFIIMILPAVFVSWFSYYMGSHDKRIASIFGINLKPERHD